jgi:hypothetical protein
MSVPGFDIRDERERERQYAADQAHIDGAFCPKCGTRLAQWQCQYGCTRALGERFNYKYESRWFSILKIGDDWYQAISIIGNTFSGNTPALAIKFAIESERQFHSDPADCEWAQESESGGMWDEHIRHGQA